MTAHGDKGRGSPEFRVSPQAPTELSLAHGTHTVSLKIPQIS
jgi:hypothetical protein